MKRIALAAVCGVWLTGGTALTQVSGLSAPPIKANIDQLGWIAGAWTGTLGDRTIEQHWSAPRGGLEGRAAVFEAPAAGGPVRVTFRSPDSRTLNITVARQRAGVPVTTEFKYTRTTP